MLSERTRDYVDRVACLCAYDTFVDLSNPKNRGSAFSWQTTLGSLSRSSARCQIRIGPLPVRLAKTWPKLEPEIMRLLEGRVAIAVQDILERSGVNDPA